MGLLFREHPKAQQEGGFRRSPGSNLRPLVYKPSDLTTAPRVFSYFCSKHRSWEHVLTSTHNLCFEAKIREIGIPLHTQVLPYKNGVYHTWKCFPDDMKYQIFGNISQ